jgi:hypothetical protein
LMEKNRVKKNGMRKGREELDVRSDAHVRGQISYRESDVYKNKKPK